MPCLQKRAGQPSAVQRHHMEIALICLSGTVLCCSLWSSGPHAWSWQGHSLLFTHILALVLEFGTEPLVSPYKLRKSETHGLAQGVLAVPSVLAALAATTPGGNFDHWLFGSCAASVAVLLTVYLQSRTAVACTRPTNSSAARSSHVNTILQQKQQQVQDSSSNHSQSIVHKQPCQHMFTLWPYMSAASVACLAATMLPWQAPLQELVSSHVPSRISVQHAETADVTGANSHAAAAVGATAAPTLYCLIMRILPGCFSIGEGVLMAEGAAVILIASVQSLPYAPLFIPAAVCHWMPQPVVQQLHSMGSCSSMAQQQTLSLDALSAAMNLIVAAVLLVCLLLRGISALVHNISSTDQHSQTHSTSNPGSSILSSSRISSWLAISVLATAICLILLWLACAAAWTLLEFIPAWPSRMLVLLYWVALLAVTLPALRLWASHSSMPQIVIRKVYHLLAGGLFVPVFFWDLQLLCLSLAIAFAALVLLEVLRRLQLPGLGQAVQRFMQDFVDARDSGVIYVTHFTLLLGLAVPIWLCLSLPGAQGFTRYSIGSYNSSTGDFCSRKDLAGGVCGRLDGDAAALNASSALSKDVLGHGSVSTNSWDLLLVTAGLSGMVIIGVGDTAASMVGKLLGQIPIHAGSRKTVEGTVAGIASSLGAWCCLLCCVGLSGGGWEWWLGLTAATVGAGLMEACTSQLDNILLPLWYMPHLMLLQRVL